MLATALLGIRYKPKKGSTDYLGSTDEPRRSPNRSIALPKGILFALQRLPFQYRDDLETVDIIYRGRCWMDEPATTGGDRLPP